MICEDEISLTLDEECTPQAFREMLKSFGFTGEGWITRDGQFWPVDQEMHHAFIAHCVLDLPRRDGDLSQAERDAETEADRLKWLRISDYGNRIAAPSLSQKQRDTLWDWCEHHGVDYRELIGRIKYLA